MSTSNQDEMGLREKYSRLSDLRQERADEREAYRALLERDHNSDMLGALKDAFENLSLPDVTYTVYTQEGRRNDQFAVVASTADLHFGKRVAGFRGSEFYDREIARDTLFETTERLIERIGRIGRPDIAYLTIGGDDLHFDNIRGSTTKGTVLELDGTPQEILHEWVEVLFGWLSVWRGFADELVIFVTPGNHNEILSQAIGYAVEAFFRNDMEVTVYTQPLPRSYELYGTTLLGFTHGDDIPHKRLPNLMAQEASPMWSGADTRLFFLQHEHHLETYEEGGVTLLKQPTLSPADKWHDKKGYKSRPRNMAYLVHHEGGFTIMQVEG
jgi:hypothetical protein